MEEFGQIAKFEANVAAGAKDAGQEIAAVCLNQRLSNHRATIVIGCYRDRAGTANKVWLATILAAIGIEVTEDRAAQVIVAGTTADKGCNRKAGASSPIAVVTTLAARQHVAIASRGAHLGVEGVCRHATLGVGNG